MYKEYAPVTNLIIIKGSISERAIDMIAVINIISLIRLIEGGAAIFRAQNINHHIDRVG
jgi:hypothetical protein